MKLSPRKTLALAFLLVGPGIVTPGLAQQPKARPADAPQSKDRFTSIKEIDKHFDQQHHDVEQRRLEAMAALAQSQSGEEAESTYQHLFSLAIVEGRVEDAEPAAESYLEGKNGQPKTRALAAFIDMFAAASRDEYDQAVEVMQSFLKGSNTEKIDPDVLYSLGESFLQRLILDGKFDTAKKACQLFTEGPFDKDVKAHFASRLERLNMLGKPAPAIAGRDIDGQPVSLAEMKGKVVLVEFWASWCPPCLSAIPRLNDLYERYHDKGFEILGVNVDAKREGSNPQEIRSTVRSLLIEFLVSWRVLIDSPGGEDLATKYGVTEIPATFLIDQDGKVARVELTDSALDQAVAKLLGVEAEATSSPSPAGANPDAAPARPLPDQKLPQRKD